MAITKLTLGARGDINNSTGSDLKVLTDSVIDIVEDGASGNAALKGKFDSKDIVESVDSLVDLLSYTSIPDGKKFDVTGFYANTTVGGGVFRWDASASKAGHNGGTVIAPEALTAWNGTSGDITTLLDWTGTGSGCFVRSATNKKQVDFSWFGALIGSGNSTLACDKALSSLPAHSFYWEKGTLTVDYLKLDTDQSIVCGGFGHVLTHAPNSTEDLIQTRNPASSVRITLSMFRINGDKSTKSSSVAGINLDATGMNSAELPRHILSKLFITNTKGTGLVHPFPGRDSNYSDIVIYDCDGNGLELFGSDSQFNNINIGQSGFAGLKVSGGSANLVCNTKSWYSGRIDETIGHGFWIRNGTGTQMSNCESQENKLDGLFAEGTSSELTGISVSNFVSNSDNTSSGLGNGVRLINVKGAVIGAKVWAVAELAGSPSDAISIGGGTTGCRIDLMASDFTSYAIDGTKSDIDNNQINLNNRDGNVFTETSISGNKTFSQFASKTFDFTLSGNVTIKAPTSRAYSGMELVFWLRQDATGGHSISFDSQFKTNFTADLTSNAINVFKFKADRDSNWIQESFNSLS